MSEETRKMLEELGYTVTEDGSVYHPVGRDERELLDAIREIATQMSSLIEKQRASSLRLAKILLEVGRD